MRQSATASGPDVSPFRGAGSQLHVLVSSPSLGRRPTGAAERQLLVYLGEGLLLFGALCFDAHLSNGGPGVGSVLASLLVTLLGTGVIFGLSRWHTLLDQTVGGWLAVVLSGGLPAWLGSLNQLIYAGLPGVFTRSSIALLWAGAVALACALAAG